MSATTWYLCACIDCGKGLKFQGNTPAKPICLHCDVIRAAPEHMRDLIRKTLAPLPPDDEGAPTDQ